MIDIFKMTGILALTGFLIWSLIWWSRRGQRKIKEEQEEGWKEAGKKH
tara:strand:+ start:2398 stop:2541 length:144 start_codon:yes stop_codon:yes gene_type:complete